MRIASVGVFAIAVGCSACKPDTSAQDAKLASIRANVCEEAADLPKLLQDHLTQQDQLVQRSRPSPATVTRRLFAERAPTSRAAPARTARG